MLKALFLATSLFFAACLSGCSASGPELRVPGTMGPAGDSQENVQAGASWSFGITTLCLTGPGSVTVTDVAFEQPTGGLRIEAFATRPNPYPLGQAGLGAEPGTLASLGRGFVLGGLQPIDTVCPKPGEEQSWTGGSELAIQASKTLSGMARSSSLVVTYATAGLTRTLAIPFGISLCAVGTQGPCP